MTISLRNMVLWLLLSLPVLASDRDDNTFHAHEETLTAPQNAHGLDNFLKRNASWSPALSHLIFDDGTTPLILAARFHANDALISLLNNDVDVFTPFITIKPGSTIIQRPRTKVPFKKHYRRRSDLESLNERHQCFTQIARPSSGSIALHWAAFSDNALGVKNLLAHGYAKEQTLTEDENGKTPLDIALINSNIRALIPLLEGPIGDTEYRLTIEKMLTDDLDRDRQLDALAPLDTQAGQSGEHVLSPSLDLLSSREKTGKNAAQKLLHRFTNKK